MASTPESFEITKRRHDEAERERRQALSRIEHYCETGQRHLVIPFLMVNMQRTPALRRIRLWQLDSVMFHSPRSRAYRTIRQMRELIGDRSHVKDGFTTVGWALENREASVRMSTWLYLLLLREKLTKFELPEGFPYGLLYDNTSDDMSGKE